MGLLFSISACFFLTGCFFSDTTVVTAVLPPFPPSWVSLSGDMEYEIRYCYDGNEKHVYQIREGEGVDILIEKGITAVAAYPVSGSYTMLPAGGIFPCNGRGDELELSWENGFASVLIHELTLRGVDFSNFNIERFEKTLYEKSGMDPWRLSDMEIRISLSSQVFNSNFVRNRRSFSIAPVSPLLEGSWGISDPLDTRIFKSIEGRLVMDMIYTGHYVLFKTEPEPLFFAELFIDDEGWKILFSTPEGGLSGNL